jgi:hypothetical protein
MFFIFLSSPSARSRYGYRGAGYARLKTIEDRFDLAPLTSRDAAVNDLSNAFNAPQVPQQ